MQEVGRDLECRVVTQTELQGEPGSRVQQERWRVPVESPLTLWVNHRRWVTLMCTPAAQRQLALGFAYFAGLFQDLGQVLLLHDCPDDPNRMEMVLAHEVPDLPAGSLITSGCGQGVSPEQVWPDYRVPKVSPWSPSQVRDAMRQLQEGSVIHRSVGGTHASGLSDGHSMLALYEDIGRHNTVDKLMGHALLVGQDTAGLALVTSGRISSEMLYKAIRMRASIVVSRTAPTDVAIEMAIRYGLTLIGYARGNRYTVFAGPNGSA
ncbi:MAG: formate dehydrogenase accessory sulfurtransferase FdhD [Anaerolineae bacterium]|nr:formate dehydrogenase accessory sulfurtransferase FdhD [Anaerolineae bacterium]